MNVAVFLPEEDQDFLSRKSLLYHLREEAVGSETRRGVEFPEFDIPANLGQRKGDVIVPGGTVRMLVLIPKGYAKVRLDSWYVSPSLFHLNGQPIDRANSDQALFGETWQFWSRHLTEQEWRANIDGLETYIQYIRAGLKDP